MTIRPWKNFFSTVAVKFLKFGERVRVKNWPGGISRILNGFHEDAAMCRS